MTRMRAGAAALLLTAGTGLVLTGVGEPGLGRVEDPQGHARAGAGPGRRRTAQSFVDRAYADLLDIPAAADPAGVAYWICQVNAGHAPRERRGCARPDRVLPQPPRRAWLPPGARPRRDPSGLAYWSNYLAHGGNVDQLTGSLVGSLEYTSNYGANYDAFVKATYQTLLGHGPDAAGETYWDTQLAAGNPMWHVAASISHSLEWYQNRVTYDFVYYHVGFPDTGGLAYWTSALQHGTPSGASSPPWWAPPTTRPSPQPTPSRHVGRGGRAAVARSPFRAGGRPPASR